MREINDDQVIEVLRKQIADDRGIDLAAISVTSESRLREDLEIDSLASIDVAITLEEEFGIELGDDTVANSETVQDLVRLMSQASNV